MPYIPHTKTEIKSMLDAIGVESIDDLFDEIPASLRAGDLTEVPVGESEMAVSRLMHERAAQDGQSLCFLGAGAYEHHIPAAVWELTTRGEFYTAYTPYQAEASQGTLQLLYEYQSMMTGLTGMDVSNASLYDGASAMAEAVLMAVRANRKSKSKRVLVPGTVNPAYRKTAHAIVHHQGITLEQLDYDQQTGVLDINKLPTEPGDFAALIIPLPNFLGRLEDLDALTDWAHQHKALVIAVVNPVALGLIKPPSEWGEKGADITCGEGQPLGIPMSSGGPYYGFMACTQALVRQMPGRIIGRTVDLDGKTGYTLTLQAREQHIRRSRATSNICTNQGLMITASTIHMAILGEQGLGKVASQCHANTRSLVKQLTALEGVSLLFEGSYFHEVILRFEVPVKDILKSMTAQNILAGLDLSEAYPELGNCLLVCATEMRSEQDIERYAKKLENILLRNESVKCPIKPKW
ncbi:MAG TPA: aminomethyl-transferring glycine dehydrogenase subunit GcvPA [Gammaproteobacteria bacterium]|nr:aminomethyl-transferring glycine dehydrogenase subunit GcvPA [Gammaproteobacteria bacterium]